MAKSGLSDLCWSARMIAQGIKTMKPTEMARHIASMPNTKNHHVFDWGDYEPIPETFRLFDDDLGRITAA